MIVGLVGMAAAPDVAGNWFGHPHGSMMGWWDGTAQDQPAPAPIGDAPQVDVQAGEFVFDPSRIEIRAGRPVNISMQNRGTLLHDFTVEEFNFRLRAAPGARATGGIQVAEQGSYRFVCTVPGHSGAGMVGTLVVR